MVKLKFIVTIVMLFCLTLPMTQCTRTFGGETVSTNPNAVEVTEFTEITEVTTTQYIWSWEWYFVIVWLLPLPLALAIQKFRSKLFQFSEFIISGINLFSIFVTGLVSTKLMPGYYVAFIAAVLYFVTSVIENLKFLVRWLRPKLTRPSNNRP